MMSLYNFVNLFTTAYLHSMYNLDVSGSENIPKNGPAILAANHKSWLDIPIVASLTTRHVRFVAKQELIEYTGVAGIAMKYFFDKMDIVPVKRGKCGSSVIKGCLRNLELGHMVAVFPEGTRYYDDKIHGFARLPDSLSQKKHVPIIPIGIRGSVSYWRERVIVNVGEPLERGHNLQEIVSSLSGYEIQRDEPDSLGINRELI